MCSSLAFTLLGFLAVSFDRVELASWRGAANYQIGENGSKKNPINLSTHHFAQHPQVASLLTVLVKNIALNVIKQCSDLTSITIFHFSL